jgi:2,3-bisphosphoglycerate-independent phosphoglycerate mutase
MVNRGLDLSSDAGDLGLQGLDPRVQFFDRERVEILSAERDERVVGAAGQDFFRIHGSQR